MTIGIPPYPYDAGDDVIVLEGSLAGHVGVVQAIIQNGAAVSVELHCMPGYVVPFLTSQIRPLTSDEREMVYGHSPMFDGGTFVEGEVVQEPMTGLNPLKQGLSSAELGEMVGKFIGNCTGRITGVGSEQYETAGEGGQVQKFEHMELDELLAGLQEELEDIPNYAAMLWIRVERIRNALKDLDKL